MKIKTNERPKTLVLKIKLIENSNKLKIAEKPWIKALMVICSPRLNWFPKIILEIKPKVEEREKKIKNSNSCRIPG